MMAREYHLDAPDGFQCLPTSSMATNVSLTFLMIPLTCDILLLLLLLLILLLLLLMVQYW